MVFNPSEEQSLLEDTVSRLVSGAALDQKGEVTDELWSAMVELGLSVIAFSEEDGGMGEATAHSCIVARQLGKIPGELPFLASAVIGSALIRDAADGDQRRNYLSGLADGSVVLAFAHSEPGARYDLSKVSTKVSASEGRLVLDGRKTLVQSGDWATTFVVTAREWGDDSDPDGLSLFLVPADAPGVEVQSYKTHDGRHDADLSLNGVVLHDYWRLGEAGSGIEAIRKVNDLAIAVSCSEAVGAMEALLEATVEYLKVRKQFGVPIASFQALKFCAADMFVEIEQAKSMAAFAAWAFDENRAESSLFLQAAKAQVSAAARFVAETAVQLHGGIGMTMESRTGRLFQRLTNFQLRFGDRRHCLQTLARAQQSILEF